jgi:hypothetical protein
VCGWSEGRSHRSRARVTGALVRRVKATRVTTALRGLDWRRAGTGDQLPNEVAVENIVWISAGVANLALVDMSQIRN